MTGDKTIALGRAEVVRWLECSAAVPMDDGGQSIADSTLAILNEDAATIDELNATLATVRAALAQREQDFLRVCEERNDLQRRLDERRA